jgi:hypothetical protein
MESQLAVRTFALKDIVTEFLEQLNHLFGAFVLIVSCPCTFNSIIPVLFELNGGFSEF